MPPKDFVLARRGTLAEWAAKSPSPVLVLGEIGIETDTHRMKCGDGVTAWSSLPYLTSTFDLEDVPVQVARDTDAILAARTDPFLEGQLIYNKTTGATKIGDGSSLYADLPDIRKQFQNVVTVAKSGKKGFADFICSDSRWGGSDSACIQAAIDYCAAHDIIELWIFDGTYIFSIKVSITHDITIRGIGKVIFQSSQPSGGLPEIIDFSGSKITTITGSDVLAGNTSITVSDASNIQIGDLLLISDNTKWNVIDYPNLNTGELHEVDYISGSSVSFIDGLLHSYTATNSLSIDVIRPISALVYNIEFKGTSNTVVGGLVQFEYCKCSSVLNCTFGADGYYGVSITNSLNTRIHKNKCKNFKGSGYGYGIVVNDASAHTCISDNTMSQCRHNIASGGHAAVGQPRDIRVINNNLNGANMDGGHVVDAHSCVESIYVLNNTIDGNTDFAFCSGAKVSVFCGNILSNGCGVTTRGTLQDMVFVIEDNTAYHCTYMFLDTLTTGGSVALAKLTNNQMLYTDGYLAYTKITQNVQISNNFIDKTSDYYGMYFTNLMTGNISNNSVNNTHRAGLFLISCQNVNICNNEILNPNQHNESDAAWGSGITLTHCLNCKIKDNTIRDNYSHMKYCIYENGTSNNNKILHNNLSGAVVKPISILGANTKIISNYGYTTENTGTATILASATSIIVSHGLALAPTKIVATPYGNVGNCWVDPASITATRFTLYCATAPIVDTLVAWSVVV